MAEVTIQVELLNIPELKALITAALQVTEAWNSEDNDALTEGMIAQEKALIALGKFLPPESEVTDGK